MNPVLETLYALRIIFWASNNKSYLETVEKAISKTKFPDISNFGVERFSDLDALIKSHIQLSSLGERALLALNEDHFPMLRHELRDALAQAETVNSRWYG